MKRWPLVYALLLVLISTVALAQQGSAAGSDKVQPQQTQPADTPTPDKTQPAAPAAAAGSDKTPSEQPRPGAQSNDAAKQDKASSAQQGSAASGSEKVQPAEQPGTSGADKVQPQQPAQKPPQQDNAANKSSQAATDPTDPNDPLFGVPPLPKGKVSLVGGTVQKVDRLRNRVAVRTFGDGGKKMTFAFDERSHIYRDGVETTERGIRQGDRVYVDSMLESGRLFARNIRVVTSLKPTDAQGQIVAYEPRSGQMTIRDDLSAATVSFHVAQSTVVKGGGGQGAVELVPGSLVTVRFSADPKFREVAREINVLAVPGNTFTFAGKVRYLDLSRRTIAVENLTDNKTYELQFDPGAITNNVTVGSDVSVAAVFSGTGYKARTIEVSQARE